MHKLCNEELLQKMQQLAIKLHNKDPTCPLFIIDSLSKEATQDFSIRHEQIKASGSIENILNQHYMLQGEYGIVVSLDGQTVVLAGISPFWPEVGEMWCLFSEDVSKLVRKNLRQFLQLIRYYVDLVPQQRIQTIVKEDFEIGIKFIERFGFKSEGLMRKYGPEGQSYYRYAHIKEDK